MSECIPIRDNVDLIKLGQRSIYLVGTAHISQSSADLAEEVIREYQPNSVAVELCQARHKSLKDPSRWKNTDIYSVIRDGKAYVLMSQLILAAFQKKLGKHLDVNPGAEMLRAVSVSEEIGAETVLADRDVKVTLKRTWAALGFWSMLKIIGAMLMGLFTNEKLEQEDVERLKSADALEELMKEFSDKLPEVRTALIDERDQYLAEKIKSAPGDTVVAIVGAGHVPGIKKWIDRRTNLEVLEKIPPPKITRKLIAWSIPTVVVALIAWGFYNSGLEKGWDMIETWTIVNAALGGLGAALALAHPLTIAVAFIVSPFTSLNPLIAAGWVAGLVEAAIKKPRVSDLETIAEDISSIKGIWNNRVSKILLVICLTNLFGSIGTFLGIYLLS